VADDSRVRRHHPKRTFYTQAQASVIGEEYRLLILQAQQQAVEHKMWLVMQINGLSREKYQLTEDHHTQLVREANEVTFSSVMIERGEDKSGKEVPIVSIVYEYPDLLFAFLSRPEVGSLLNLAAQGGMVIDEKPLTTVEKPLTTVEKAQEKS
jgi:hypothetical protein